MNKILTLNKLVTTLELLGLLFLGTSNCFLMGEFSFNNDSLGIINLVLFLKLHPWGTELVPSAICCKIRFWHERIVPTELDRLRLI